MVVDRDVLVSVAQDFDNELGWYHPIGLWLGRGGVDWRFEIYDEFTMTLN
jgi:hypothetical protein